MAPWRPTLHCGEIVAGEIGDLRREIAYVGDTLNVAARLLEAAKARGRDILVSADLLKSVALPADLRAERLSTLTIRGRNAPLEIFALARVGQDQVGGLLADHHAGGIGVAGHQGRHDRGIGDA